MIGYPLISWQKTFFIFKSLDSRQFQCQFCINSWAIRKRVSRYNLAAPVNYATDRTTRSWCGRRDVDMQGLTFDSWGFCRFVRLTNEQKGQALVWIINSRKNWEYVSFLIINWKVKQDVDENRNKLSNAPSRVLFVRKL